MPFTQTLLKVNHPKSSAGTRLKRWVQNWYPGSVAGFAKEIGVSRDAVYKGYFVDLTEEKIAKVKEVMEQTGRFSEAALRALDRVWGSESARAWDKATALERENEILRELVETQKKRIQDLENR